MKKHSDTHFEIIFERRQGGRYYIHSPDVRGLHLAGPRLEDLSKIVETAIKDLLWHNADIVVDRLRWVPSLDKIAEQLARKTSMDKLSEKKIAVLNIQKAA